MHSREGEQEHYSKLTKGEGNPESLQRGHKETSSTVQDLGMDFEPSGGEKMFPSVQELWKKFQPPSFTLKGEQSFQQGRQMHSREGEQEHYSKLTKGEGNPESLQRGNNVEIDITRALEFSRQEMERIMDQKMAVLRNQLEVSQNAASPLEEQANTRTFLQAISEKLHNLQVCLQNLEVSREQDLQILREEMEGRITKAKKSWTKDCLLEIENKLERTVDINTTRALESTQQEAEKILSEKVAVLQNQLEVSQNAYREELISLESKLEFFIIQIYKVDISLDADTAHPRLEVSEDGKSVKDTGMIRKVPMRQKRFDSHLFVLAKEGYTSGRFYWEVNVGKRRNWILGVAQESVTRKGTVTLSPNNGFSVIGLVDGQEYWAYMDPWIHLAVTGTLQNIGIFLDISTKQLSFYNVHKKTILHAFTIADDSMQEGKLIPIFSTGSASAKIDLEPLSLV